MSNQTSNGQQQMQAEQPKEEPKLSSAPKAPPSAHGAGGTADLGYLNEDGDGKFLPNRRRDRKEIAQL